MSMRTELPDAERFNPERPNLCANLRWKGMFIWADKDDTVPPSNLPSRPTQVCVCRHQKLPVFDGGTVSSLSAQMNIPFQRRLAQRLGRSGLKRSASGSSVLIDMVFPPRYPAACKIARLTATLAS